MKEEIRLKEAMFKHRKFFHHKMCFHCNHLLLSEIRKINDEIGVARSALLEKLGLSPYMIIGNKELLEYAQHNDR